MIFQAGRRRRKKQVVTTAGVNAVIEQGPSVRDNGDAPDYPVHTARKDVQIAARGTLEKPRQTANLQYRSAIEYGPRGFHVDPWGAEVEAWSPSICRDRGANSVKVVGHIDCKDR